MSRNNDEDAVPFFANLVIGFLGWFFLWTLFNGMDYGLVILGIMLLLGLGSFFCAQE